jgi:uncharacterized membrane protein
MQLCAWLGGFSPPVLRLPAFLSGVLMIPASAFCALTLSGKKTAALLAAGFVASSSILVEYSTNARGYSLVGLAVLVMAWLSILLSQNPSAKWVWAAWGFAAIFGLYAVPTMLQAVVLMAVLLLLAGGFLKWKEKAPYLVVTLVCVGVVTACLYIPVIRENGLKALVANRWVVPESLPALRGDTAQLFSDIWSHWTRDSSSVTLALLAVGLLAGAVGGVRQRNIFWGLPFFAMAVMFLFVLLQRRAPPARACLYILPLVFTVTGVGLVYLCELFAGSNVRRANMAIAVCGLLTLAGWAENVAQIQHNDYMISENPTTCVNAEALVKLLAAHGFYRGSISALWDLEVSAPFTFYYFASRPANARVPPDVPDPRCRQTYILLRHPETIQKVYFTTPHLRELFQPPQLVCKLPTATVFVCDHR